TGAGDEDRPGHGGFAPPGAIARGGRQVPAAGLRSRAGRAPQAAAASGCQALKLASNQFATKASGMPAREAISDRASSVMFQSPTLIASRPSPSVPMTSGIQPIRP